MNSTPPYGGTVRVQHNSSDPVAELSRSRFIYKNKLATKGVRGKRPEQRMKISVAKSKGLTKVVRG